MNTVHLWFRSGSYSLLGHLEIPRQRRGHLGAIIVPPFGWEDVCSYRPLRFMARKLAQAGIPTLRYDLPGTGDSSGDALDPGLFDAWVRSVDDAAAELRRSADVEDVAVVGIHLGAMLAMTAAARYTSLQRLVLWGAAGTGHTLIRELRAAANMERWEYLGGQDAPPQPIAGFEAGGFLLAPETLNALEHLDVAALPWLRVDNPVLLLSRDDLPHDPALVNAFHGFACGFETAKGSGYTAMMAAPQEALFPEESSRLIAGFLSRSPRAGPAADTGPTRHSLRHAVTHLVDPGGVRASESIQRIEASSLEMFGILSEPAPGVSRRSHGVLFLNAGAVRHTGPNRMWVESARRWAERGVVSLRLDLPGIGESDGEQFLDVPGLYRESLVEQIGVAIESLRQRAGVKRVVTVGLCSGACWAFHAAKRYTDVRGAILVNPSLLYWDPSVDRRRILPHFASGFNGWAKWARMVGSGIRRGGVELAAQRIAERLGRTGANGNGYIRLGSKTVEQAWSSFERGRKRVTLVFREGEPLLAEMEAAGQLPPDTSVYTHCVRVINGGHTFRPMWAQQILHELIDAELARMIPAGASDSAPHTRRTVDA